MYDDEVTQPTRLTGRDVLALMQPAYDAALDAQEALAGERAVNLILRIGVFAAWCLIALIVCGEFSP